MAILNLAAINIHTFNLNVSSCILLALACASTGAWPSFLTNAIFIGVGCTMIWRVRNRLARRIMQVVRFFDVRRFLPRRARLARSLTLR